MNTKNKLSIGMGLLFIFTFCFLGYIVLGQKKNEILIPKIQKKLINYTKSKYKNIYEDLKLNKAKYNISDESYTMTFYNKKNKRLYFITKYKKQKITDTYKKDYLEGKTLLNSYEKTMSKKLKKNKNITNIVINYNKTLNKYSNSVQNSLIEGKDIKKLSIYNIKCDIESDTIDSNGIIKSIKNFYNYIEKNKYEPKTYSIIITNKNNIAEAIEINNLTKNIINTNLNEIVSDIINKKDVSKYKVTYKYLN